MKKLVSILLITLMILSLFTGCNKSAEKAPEATAAPAKTEITVVSTYLLPAFKAALEAAHPEIDLVVEEMATGTINGEVARRLRNNRGADLVITNLPAGEIADYVYDLSAESFTESYQTSIMKTNAIDGHSLYLPLPGGYYGYIINKTLVKELGFELPETKQDLLAIMAAAKEKGVGSLAPDGYCFGLSDIGATFLGAYYCADFAPDGLTTAKGATWIAAYEAGDATFTGMWEESTSFIKTCVDLGYLNADKLIATYNGRIDTDANAFKAEQQLVDRTAILTFGNIEMLELIQSKSQDEIVMLPCLSSDGSGNKLLSAVSNNYIGINKTLSADETKLKAALTVLEYLSTTEGQAAWIKDSLCPHSYLKDYAVDTSLLPESIRELVQKNMVFSNPFPSNMLSFLGKTLTEVVKGKTEADKAMAALDEYNKNGSDDIEYDLSVVGTVANDMLLENANVRKQETEIGNLIADAVKEMSGADIALVNGGGIRSSFYKGDITGEDLLSCCPYGNLVIVAEMDGATLKAAITNGIQKTWKPAGQFLQVSGIKYSFKPAADETQVAELTALTYADGTEVKDTDTVKVAYTNYMGGSSGYVDAGDGYTMLNVYDANTPINVKLVTETNKTYRDALKEYFANHNDAPITGKLEGRITVE